jgi:predicted transport protein
MPAGSAIFADGHASRRIGVPVLHGGDATENDEYSALQSRANLRVLNVGFGTSRGIKPSKREPSMSVIKLFRTSEATAIELSSGTVALEKSLQKLIEANLETFFGVRFLAREHSTGKIHGGRIDTLGIDENHTPVIIEYKRASNENVINQGLFYLDWLFDHRGDFQVLLHAAYGAEEAEKIDWSAPRLICVAADFTKYDVHAVQQIDRNIDLVRYRRFGEDLLILELVHGVTTAAPPEESIIAEPKTKPKTGDWTVSRGIEEMDEPLQDVFEALRAFLLALGDDVTEKILKVYVAFRRIKNFATVTVGKASITAYLKLDPQTIALQENFTRDVRDVNHWGTGDLEVVVNNMGDFERAKPLLVAAYNRE